MRRRARLPRASLGLLLALAMGMPAAAFARVAPARSPSPVPSGPSPAPTPGPTGAPTPSSPPGAPADDPERPDDDIEPPDVDVPAPSTRPTTPLPRTDAREGDAAEPKGPLPRDDLDALDDEDEPTGATPKRQSAFSMPAAARTNPYGPRPKGVPELSREQIVRFALDNPAVAAAEDEVQAMKAQLDRARFLWVPQIETLTTLSPGVNVRCDDVRVDDGTPDGFDFQFCRSSDDPDLDVNTVSGYFKQLSRAGVRVAFSADAVIPLFTFGKIKNAKALARVGVALKKLEKAATQAETVLLVNRAYAGLLAAREGEAILREAKKVVERARERVEKDLGGGEDDWATEAEDVNPDRDPDDLLEIQLAELELESRMREAMKIEAVALAALWALAGKAAPPGFDVEAKRLQPDAVDGDLRPLDDYRRIAVVQRPEAKMATAAIQARAAQQRLARSNLLPDFGVALGVGIARSTSADRDMTQLYYQDGFNYSRFTAALALRWKFDLGLVFELRRARAQLRAAEHTQEAARLLLGHEVEKAYLDVVEATQGIDLAREATAVSWRLVISQEQKDTVGGGDAEKLLRALEGWYKKRFEEVEATHAHNRALAELERAVGTPLVAQPGRAASAAPRSRRAATTPTSP